ncbi:hypothetical protein GQR58_004279 [Nymphon striatum]|nr:hypothetical protein GQR58_004279 [Nymphon striatum]
MKCRLYPLATFSNCLVGQTNDREMHFSRRNHHLDINRSCFNPLKRYQLAGPVQFKDYIKSSFLRSKDMSTLPERVQYSLKQRERANEVVVRDNSAGNCCYVFNVVFTGCKNRTNNRFPTGPYVLAAYYRFIIGWSFVVDEGRTS